MSQIQTGGIFKQYRNMFCKKNDLAFDMWRVFDSNYDNFRSKDFQNILLQYLTLQRAEKKLEIQFIDSMAGALVC